MIGLLIKDLYSLKVQIKFYLIIIGISLVALLTKWDIADYAVQVIIITSIIQVPAVLISSDEKSSFTKLLLTMPVSKNNILLSKYIISIFCSFAGVFIIFILFMITNTASDISLIYLLSGSIIIPLLMFPILYKFGVENARLVLLMFIICIGLLLNSIGQVNFSMVTIPSLIADNLSIALFMLDILVFFVSFNGTRLILKNKEYQ